MFFRDVGRGALLFTSIIALGCSAEAGGSNDDFFVDESEKVAAAESAVGTYTPNTPSPDIPAISRDLTFYAADGSGTPTVPEIPPFHTSNDGRVAVAPAIVYNGSESQFQFSLLVPEKLGTPSALTPGFQLLSNSSVFINSMLMFRNQVSTNPPQYTGWAHTVTRPSGIPRPYVATYWRGFGTLCDKSSVGDVNTQAGAYACTSTGVRSSSGTYDCYDLTFIAASQSDKDPADAVPGENTFWIDLWSRDLQIIVANPKTAQASLQAVNLVGTAKMWNRPPISANAFTEFNITADGRLLIADTKGRRDGHYETIVYSYNQTGPCDIDGWTTINNISHAYNDPDVNNRYGFAAYQMRDTEGTPIADGQYLFSTYPWIDRKGANLFFESYAANLYSKPAGATGDPLLVSRYPATCVGATCSGGLGSPMTTTNNGIPHASNLSQVEELYHKIGVSWVGSWSHGKVVLLDGPINHADFGLMNSVYTPGSANDHRRNIHLYADNTSPAGGTASGWVPVGAPHGNSGTTSARNLAFIEGSENLYAYSKNLVPGTPRDVVENLNLGKVTGEVVFDDQITQSAFIVSEMMPSVTNLGTWATLNDGFTRSYGVDTQNATPRVQNSATSTTLAAVPAYGTLVGGARIEPVAAGGVFGRGVFLDGVDDAITYPIATAPITPNDMFYAGIFLEPRFTNDNTVRQVLQFADGTPVSLQGTSKLLIGGQTIQLGALALTKGTWTHLGLAIKGVTVYVYIDGYHFATTTRPSTASGPLGAGTITLGASAGVAGFRGWIDDFKVLVGAYNDETYCNHARGTLVAMMDETGALAAKSLAYPSHSGVASYLSRVPNGPKFVAQTGRYACYMDTTSKEGTHTNRIPANAKPIRDAYTVYYAGGGGRLVSGKPRPDQQANPFCTSCHDSTQKRGLLPAALASQPLTMEADARRQPTQAPRRMFGVIPANLFGAGLPATTIQESTGNGMLLDQWLWQERVRSLPTASSTYIMHGYPGVNWRDSVNHGAEAIVISGYAPSYWGDVSTATTLVKFSFASADDFLGSDVSSAVLHLYGVDGWGINGGCRVINRLTEDWTSSGATWLVRDGANPWTTLGGTFASEGRAQSATGSGAVDIDVTAIVQAWAGGRPNYGIAVNNGCGWSGGYNWQKATASPVLEVRYMPVR